MYQSSASAKVTFRTAELKRLATVLSIPTDSMKPGYNSFSPNGNAIVVHIDENAIADHIGLSLFPEPMKKIGNRVVMEFIERYMLQLQFPPATKTAAMMLRDDEVKFTKGTVATVRQLLPTDQFNLSCELMKYTATWQREGKTLLSLTFPAEFELLRGMNFIEAQQLFEGESRKAIGAVKQDTPADKQLMKATGIENCYLLEGGYYLNQKLNANRYYVEDAKGRLFPLLSEDHPVESVANLMLCQDIAQQRKLHIIERLYGYEQKDFHLDLSQWIAFCRDEHCELYFGVQTLTPTSVKATVIAVNTVENYNHMLTLDIPFAAISNPSATIEAQLNCYLPMHNIRNLFGKDNSKKKAKYHL
jgi:hypothetical protein